MKVEELTANEIKGHEDGLLRFSGSGNRKKVTSLIFSKASC